VNYLRAGPNHAIVYGPTDHDPFISVKRMGSSRFAFQVSCVEAQDSVGLAHGEEDAVLYEDEIRSGSRPRGGPRALRQPLRGVELVSGVAQALQNTRKAPVELRG
jgi:hypothetical protein